MRISAGSAARARPVALWTLAIVDTFRCRGGLVGWRGHRRSQGGRRRGRRCGPTKVHRGGIKRHRRNSRLCVHSSSGGISRSTRHVAGGPICRLTFSSTAARRARPPTAGEIVLARLTLILSAPTESLRVVGNESTGPAVVGSVLARRSSARRHFSLAVGSAPLNSYLCHNAMQRRVIRSYRSTSELTGDH